MMTVLNPVTKPDYTRLAADLADIDPLLAAVIMSGKFDESFVTSRAETPALREVWGDCRFRTLFASPAQAASIEALAVALGMILVAEGDEPIAIEPAVMRDILDTFAADKAVLLLAQTRAVRDHAKTQINAMGGWVAGGTA
jgi:hypothetical protein